MDVVLLIVIAQHPYFMISRRRALASVLPCLPEIDLDEEIAENAFMVGQQYAFYMVQNDYECCS